MHSVHGLAVIALSVSSVQIVLLLVMVLIDEVMLGKMGVVGMMELYVLGLETFVGAVGVIGLRGLLRLRLFCDQGIKSNQVSVLSVFVFLGSNYSELCKINELIWNFGLLLYFLRWGYALSDVKVKQIKSGLGFTIICPHALILRFGEHCWLKSIERNSLGCISLIGI